MRFIFQFNKMLVLACCLANVNVLISAEQKTGTAQAPSVRETPANNAANADLTKNLTASSIATKDWLDQIDKERYGESWDGGSKLMRSTVKRNEWIKILNKTRKPLGDVKSRSVLDQRTAKDPKNLPKGEYMVMFYNSSFANKPLAYELVTLFKETDGQWRVITYQVD